MMKTGFLILIQMFTLIKSGSPSECKQIEKNIYNVHGNVLKISIPMQITLCNPSSVVKDSPIQLQNYTHYLKFKSKHPRIRQQDDKLPKLYSNTFVLLPNIETLDLSQLELEEIEPNAFRNLNNLGYLNLYDNKLRQLPEDVFHDTTKLVELNLNNNEMTKLNSKQFEKLANMKTLRLSNNKFKELPHDVFQFQNQLRFLSLTGNHFYSLRRNSFMGLGTLRELKLLRNELGLIEENAFENLINLQLLTLEYNERIIFFDVESEFENMPQLRKLSLSPGNFDCEELEKILGVAQKRNIEVIQISEHGESCLSTAHMKLT